jgi:hypothetical protein
MDNRWTEEDVRRIISNPINVGFGPFPRIIDDKVFIKAACKMIKEIGAEEYLKLLIDNLRESTVNMVIHK